MAERIESETTVLRLPSTLGSLATVALGIAAFLSMLVARFAAPYGERMPLFLVLLGADALLVAIAYFYAQGHRGAQSTQIYDAAAQRQQHIAEIERVMQTLDQTRRQLDALVLDNDELRARMAERKDPAELLGPSIESALAASRDALIHISADGVVHNLNQAATQLLHLTAPTARGKQLRHVAKMFDSEKDPARQRHSDEMVLRAVQSHTTPQKIARAVLFAGPDDEAPVSITISPILNSSAFLEGAVLRIEPEQRPAETTLAASPTVAAPELSKAAAVDPLTGLPDVHAFDARLAELLQIARLTHVSHTLLLMTIDDLESVHRQFGPAAGEEMLRKISELVLNHISPVGDAFRISLYTFAALIPDMSGDPARHLAETLRADVAGCVIQKNERQFNSTASLALEELNEGTEGADAAMEHAQRVLLDASIAGGNRVMAFQKDEVRETTRRDDQEWINWLTPRFERQQIHLVSQSIVPSKADAGAKPWVEVFVRVEEDDGHWLPPGAYLPALRRNRLTPKLDLWVLQQCLNAVQTNRELFAKYAGININLDSATVVSDEFREQAFALFAESPANGSQICFEIEEACVANHTPKVVTLMETMAPYGTRFLLDHCRGSATIGLLRKVPVEFVKFHESLVRRAMSDPLDRAELEWLAQAAHLLNRKTVASHVENKELRELMAKIGIDYMQGLAIDQLGPLLI